MAKKKTELGMDENLEALLAYLFGWVSGIIFLFLEKKSKFVKFHAAQSTVVFLPITVVVWILFAIPFVGWILAGLIEIGAFILWVILLIKAYNGEEYELPIAGEYARKLAAKVK